MRKLILFGFVVLTAVIWTVSVQSASTVQTENCICVPCPQCDDCPMPCKAGDQCDMKNVQADVSAAPAAAPAAAPTDCAHPCPTSGCAKSSAH